MGRYADAYSFRNNLINEAVDMQNAKNSLQESSPYEQLMAAKERREERLERMSSFRENVMTHFTEGAMKHILFKSFSEGKLTDSMRPLGENVIHDFVTNEGVVKLTESFKGKSYLLSEMYRLIHKYTDIVMEKVDLEKEEDDEPEVEEQTDEEFFEELDNTEDINGIGITIALRVTNAEEKFMQDNIEDKEKIQDIVQQSSNLVAASDDDDSTNPQEDPDAKDFQDETEDLTDESEKEEEPVKNESVIMVNRFISDRKHLRPRTIFEQMVMNLSESIMKDNDTRKVYTEAATERLNIKMVVESARCMYTFLEMLNTCKIKNLDEQEIKNTLENL